MQKKECPVCGGIIEKGKTTYTVDMDSGLVVVRNVPARVCSQCGEEWIPPEIAKNLERIVSQAREKGAEIEILSYESKYGDKITRK